MSDGARHSPRRGAAVAALSALALAAAFPVAGCGDDEESAPTTTSTKKTTSSSTTSTQTQTQTTNSTSTTQTATTQATTTGTTTGGGTTTTSGGSGGSAYDPERDTERNDIPPPEGSPADRFEEYCEKNPESCG